MIRTVLFFISFTLISHTFFGQNETSVKSDSYKKISISQQAKLVESLLQNSGEGSTDFIHTVTMNPNQYIPPVLFALSYAYVHNGNMDSACFWFYMAQVRAQIDLHIGVDSTQENIINSLSQAYGSGVYGYAFQNLEKIESIMKSVIEYVKNNDELYDRNWMNNFESMNESSEQEKTQLKSKTQWKNIKNKTITTYYYEFNEALSSFKK